MCKGKGRIKRILRLCHFEFFEKGEGRHKIIREVSPSFFWKRKKRDTKRIQAVSPWQIPFGKGRRERKDIAHFCFQGLKTQKTFRKLLAKKEEEEVEENVQRDSKVVKEYI